MHNINEYIPCYILQGKKESCARIERGKERKEEEDAIEAKKGWIQTQKRWYCIIVLMG